jgi:hypothetical protein
MFSKLVLLLSLVASSAAGAAAGGIQHFDSEGNPSVCEYPGKNEQNYLTITLPEPYFEAGQCVQENKIEYTTTYVCDAGTNSKFSITANLMTDGRRKYEVSLNGIELEGMEKLLSAPVKPDFWFEARPVQPSALVNWIEVSYPLQIGNGEVGIYFEVYERGGRAPSKNWAKPCTTKSEVPKKSISDLIQTASNL